MISTSDSPWDTMQRRFGTRPPKLFGSTGAILLVLVLATVCVLWTTEWMDRLHVFGGSLGSSTFYAGRPDKQGTPLQIDEDTTVYEVNEVDDANTLPTKQVPSEEPANPVWSNPEDAERPDDVVPDQPEKNREEGVTDEREEGSRPVVAETIEEGAFDGTTEEDQLPTTVPQESLQRLQICVSSTNPRTASLFHSQTLKRMGKGKFDYVVTSKKCPAGNANTPPVSVKMLYQKTLSGYSLSQLDTLFNTPENLVIVMGDEFCRCPVEICSARAHARQYYSQAYVDYLTQHPSKEGNPTVYLPLGPRLEFSPVSESEIISSANRKYMFNMIVSPTSPSRKKLASMVAKGDFGSVFVHVTPAFAGNASEAKGFIAPEEYRRILLDSKFTLCPAGHNPEAFRLFEACEAGSIPIIVKDEEYMEHACQDSFAPLLASGAPFIVLNNWSELAEALKPFQDPAKLEERQQALKTWYERFWTDVAGEFECSIAQNMEKVLKSSPRYQGFSMENYDMPECGDDEDEKDDEISAAESVSGSRDKKKVIRANTNDGPQSGSSASSTAVSTRIAPTPLIVGCGRTGTLSLSHYLVKSAGVKSVHEKIEPYSVSVSWLYAVPDAATYPFEGKRSPGFRKWKAKVLKKTGQPLFAPVVHLVRHPLKVISSTRRCFCGRGTRSTGLGQASDTKSWQFVDQHIRMPKPNLPYDSLLRSMTYWYEWNTMIPKRHKVAMRFRIEDLDPNQLVNALKLEIPEGVELPHRVPRAPSHVSPEAEKTLLPDATWKDMYKEDPALAEQIFRLAKEYGYEKDAEKLADLM